MSERPNMETAMKLLSDIIEAEEPVQPDDLLIDTDLDSLDVLEFMFALGIEADEVMDDEDLMGSIESMTVGQLYTRLIEAADAADPRATVTPAT